MSGSSMRNILFGLHSLSWLVVVQNLTIKYAYSSYPIRQSYLKYSMRGYIIFYIIYSYTQQTPKGVKYKKKQTKGHRHTQQQQQQALFEVVTSSWQKLNLYRCTLSYTNMTWIKINRIIRHYIIYSYEVGSVVVNNTLVYTQIKWINRLLS